MRLPRYTAQTGRVPAGTPIARPVYLHDHTSPEGRPLDGDDTDQVLVERARAGDLDAYEVLVRRHQAIAYRTAALVAGPGDAEDAVQEAFVKAYRALDRFRTDRAFRPWLLRIVANEASNTRRSAGRRYGLAVRVGRQAWTGPVSPDPELDVELAETSATLLGLLGRLPERERQVIVCRYLLELSEAETAQVLDIPAGTAKSRHARGLARLRVAARGIGLSAVEEGVDHHA
jgi:RNA polymerase sigma-70 factor (ECF subfamily)